MSEYSTVHPMPGEVEDYLETIVTCVQYVDVESPSESELIDWSLIELRHQVETSQGGASPFSDKRTYSLRTAR